MVTHKFTMCFLLTLTFITSNITSTFASLTDSSDVIVTQERSLQVSRRSSTAGKYFALLVGTPESRGGIEDGLSSSVWPAIPKLVSNGIQLIFILHKGLSIDPERVTLIETTGGYKYPDLISHFLHEALGVIPCGGAIAKSVELGQVKRGVDSGLNFIVMGASGINALTELLEGHITSETGEKILHLVGKSTAGTFFVLGSLKTSYDSLFKSGPRFMRDIFALNKLRKDKAQIVDDAESPQLRDLYTQYSEFIKDRTISDTLGAISNATRIAFISIAAKSFFESLFATPEMATATLTVLTNSTAVADGASVDLGLAAWAFTPWVLSTTSFGLGTVKDIAFHLVGNAKRAQKRKEFVTDLENALRSDNAALRTGALKLYQDIFKAKGEPAPQILTDVDLERAEGEDAPGRYILDEGLKQKVLDALDL